MMIRAIFRTSLPALALWVLTGQIAGCENAYVANNYDGTISVINTVTDKVMATISAGKQPWAVAVTPYGKRLYISNHRAINMVTAVNSEVTAIETATHAILASITLDNQGPANGLAISPDGSDVYVTTGHRAIEDANAVTVINTKTNQISARKVMPHPDNDIRFPYAVAVSPDGKSLYVVHREGVGCITVIDTATRKVVREIFLFGEGKESHASSSVAISPDGKTLYVAGESGAPFAVADVASGRVSFPVGNLPPLSAMALSPDGRRIYIAGEQTGTAVALDTKTFAMIPSAGISRSGATLYVGDSKAIAFTPDGRKAYITDSAGNQVFVIDVATNAVIGKIPVGRFPLGIAIGKAPSKPSAK